MKRIRFLYLLTLLCINLSLSAGEIEKYERELLILEDEAGRIKSDILRFEKEILEINSQIELNKHKTEEICKELENIVRILFFINIEKKINPIIMKDIETKNIRYGEYIKSMIEKYDENLSLIYKLNNEYREKIEVLNQRLKESNLAKKNLEAKIERVYELISEKYKKIEKDVIAYKKISSVQREESSRRIDDVISRNGEKQSFDTTNEEFKIILPVREGDLIREFGAYYDEGMQLEKFSKGILLKSPFLSEVYCVSDGKVLFSGWLKGFGNTVIVEHRAGFISVYSHLARAEVSKGEEVKERDVIGFVGDTGSGEGVVLYFELRKNGRAVDPMHYIK